MPNSSFETLKDRLGGLLGLGLAPVEPQDPVQIEVGHLKKPKSGADCCVLLHRPPSSPDANVIQGTCWR